MDAAPENRQTIEAVSPHSVDYHFTYEPDPRANLSQGDVIARSPEVMAMLREVHPHYFQNSSYKFFIILTQSCDLVRRNGEPCKARYISVAAVRPLQMVIERELTKHQHTELEKRLKFCNKDAQPKMLQFMERLLNNNEDEFFFLRREPKAGILEDCCAFLHLSIAVKSELHYKTLLAARILQITDSFQHKLGYLVGNLYSRVGTEDWVPDTCDSVEFERLRREPIEDEKTVLWLEKSVYKAAITKLKKKEASSLEDLHQVIVETKESQENKKQQVLKAVTAVLVDSGLDTKSLERVIRRVENQPDFQAAFK